MQQHGSKYLARRRLTPRLGSKCQNETFSEHGYVAYQIKGNDKCRNMQAHILSLHTLGPFGWGQNVRIFFSESSYVAYCIKGD